jgi:DNA-directed RNA polymerase I, II, and III subunit RPABC5
MIIPIRCYTCGKVIADLWEPYLKMVQEGYNEDDAAIESESVIVKRERGETVECKALNTLGLKSYCCRRMILAHVDLCEKI